MELLNRGALIVRPKRRLVDWVNGLPLKGSKLTLEKARSQPTVFLVEAPERLVDDASSLIDLYADELFEELLAAWIRDEEHWPPNRTPHVFRDWFDVEFIDLVLDVEDELPLLEDDEDLIDEELIEELRERALYECAWCHAALEEETERFAVGLHHDRLEELAGLEGQPFPVPLSRGPIIGIVTMPDSDARKEGKHIVFTLCSERCGSELKQAFEAERGARLS